MLPNEDFSKAFNEIHEAIANEQEQFWSGLTKEDQLKAFCAVVRRICKGELDDKGSYRHVLYKVFGFGPESYAQAQMAGYLGLHNCIHDADYDTQLLEAFCKVNNIEGAELKIRNWVI